MHSSGPSPWVLLVRSLTCPHLSGATPDVSQAVLASGSVSGRDALVHVLSLSGGCLFIGTRGSTPADLCVEYLDGQLLVVFPVVQVVELRVPRSPERGRPAVGRPRPPLTGRCRGVVGQTDRVRSG